MNALKLTALGVMGSSGIFIAVLLAAGLPSPPAEKDLLPDKATPETTRQTLERHTAPLTSSWLVGQLAPTALADLVKRGEQLERAYAQLGPRPNREAQDAFGREAEGYADGIKRCHREVPLSTSTLIVVLSVVFGAGLLGLVRGSGPRAGRRSWLIPVAVGVLAFDLLPAVMICFMCAPTIGLWVLSLVFLTAVALFLSANHLPGPAHPMVAALESELARMPSVQRRRRLLVRAVGGAVLFGVGSLLTAVTVAASGGRIGVVFIGLIVVGIFWSGGSVAVLARARWLGRSSRAA